MKGLLDTVDVLLQLAALLLIVGLFVFGIGAAFTGDGISDWETGIGIRITITMLATVGVGRILSIIRGEK